VVREVAEETGAQVRWVRYFASQPWPFPASLMLGFHAHAPQAPVQLDSELEDARWFELEQLRDVGVGLRLGSGRSSFGRVIHVDLATPLNADKSISKLQFLVTTEQSF